MGRKNKRKEAPSPPPKRTEPFVLERSKTFKECKQAIQETLKKLQEEEKELMALIDQEKRKQVIESHVTGSPFRSTRSDEDSVMSFTDIPEIF